MVAVHAEGAQGAGQHPPAGAGPDEPVVEIAVRRISVVLEPNPTDLRTRAMIDFPGPEHRRLMYIAVGEHLQAAVFDHAPVADDPAAAVDDIVMSIDHVGIRMAAKGFADGAQGTRQVGVVRAQPREDLAGGAREALANRLGVPSVALADPPCQAMLIAPDQVDYLRIGRTTVHDDVFEIRVILVEDRTDSLFQILRAIVSGSHHGDFREHRESVLLHRSAALTPRLPRCV